MGEKGREARRGGRLAEIEKAVFWPDKSTGTRNHLWRSWPSGHHPCTEVTLPAPREVCPSLGCSQYCDMRFTYWTKTVPVLLRWEVWFELSDYSEYQPRKKCASDWWSGSPENLEKAEKTEMEGKPPSLGLILHPTGVSSYDSAYWVAPKGELSGGLENWEPLWISKKEENWWEVECWEHDCELCSIWILELLIVTGWVWEKQRRSVFNKGNMLQ